MKLFYFNKNITLISILPVQQMIPDNLYNLKMVYVQDYKIYKMNFMGPLYLKKIETDPWAKRIIIRKWYTVSDSIEKNI